MLNKGNTYTAEEILTEAGFDTDEIGEIRITIGGLNVNKPNHVINIPEASDDELEVIVGNEVKTLTLGKREKEMTLSKGAQEVRVEEGQIESQKIAERENEKSE